MPLGGLRTDGRGDTPTKRKTPPYLAASSTQIDINITDKASPRFSWLSSWYAYLAKTLPVFLDSPCGSFGFDFVGDKGNGFGNVRHYLFSI